MANGGIVEIKTKLDTAGAESGLGKLGTQFDQTGSNLTRTGGKLMAVGAGILSVGAVSVKTAATFESSMSQVQATMGITKDSMTTVNGESVNTMDALSNLAREMGSKTAFSADEAAQGLNYLALAGYDTEQMMYTLPTVLNLASAGNMELAQASDMVTDAMSALGMDTSEATTMVDQMAKTASSSNTSVAQLGEGILTIGATARTLKGGTAELNTALGLLANNGIKASEGGTHLRNVILALQSPTSQASGILKDLGVNVYDSEGKMRGMNDILSDLNSSMEGMTDAEKTNIISKIFRKTDLSAVNALLANTGETWDELQGKIEDSTGAAEDMAETQLDNLNGQLTILKSALSELGISVGQILMPAVKKIVEAIQNAVTAFNNLGEGPKKAIVIFGTVIGIAVTVMGAFLVGVGLAMKAVMLFKTSLTAIRTAWTVLNTTILASPIGWIILGITALVAAFVLLWQNSEKFRNFWKNIWDAIKSFTSAAINAIVNFFKTMPTKIMNAIKQVPNKVKQWGSKLLTSFKSVAKKVILGFANAMIPLPIRVIGKLLGLNGKVSSWGSNLVSNFKDIGRNIISGIVEGIKNKLQSLYNTLSSGLSTAKEKARKILDINSPSKEFMWIGEMTGLGMIKGFEKANISEGIGGLISPLSNNIQSQLSSSMHGLNLRGVNANYEALGDSVANALQKSGLRIQVGNREFGRVVRSY